MLYISGGCPWQQAIVSIVAVLQFSEWARFSDTLTRLRPAIVLLVVFVFSAILRAQGREPSLEELEMEYRLEQASQAFEKHDLSIEQISADFKYRCLRAIGDTTFCECLVKNRPYILRFEQYVGITSRTKAELDYETLSDNSKAIVDKAFLVRNECVVR